MPVLGSWPRLDVITLWRALPMQEVLAKTRAAVLMARIVDEAGVCIRRRMMAAVNYSLYELAANGPTLVAGHDAVLLKVHDVMFDSLRIGGEWSIDVCGYNFRHEFNAPDIHRVSRRAVRCALVYEFTPFDGPATFIRFQLKGLQR
jgi:hypothetical protein